VVGHVKMKQNIPFPATTCQKLTEMDDEHKFHTFYENRMATEVAADALDDVCQYIVRKSLNKEGKKLRTKASKIQHLLLYVSCNANTD
ncbi:hypothetical protein A6R68_11492, partial [Neotoma lepida]